MPEGDVGIRGGVSPVWLSCSVLLLHWDSPTMATILAPRLERRFLLAVMVTESALPRALLSMLYISPLMLELRTTLLAAEELASPLNMVSRSLACSPAPALLGGISWGGGVEKPGDASRPATLGGGTGHVTTLPPGAATRGWMIPQSHGIQVAQPTSANVTHPGPAREGVQDPPAWGGPTSLVPWDPDSPWWPGGSRREGATGGQRARCVTNPQAQEQEVTLRLGDSPVHLR